MRFASTITLGEKASTKEEDANQRKTEKESTGGDQGIANQRKTENEPTGGDQGIASY